MVSAGRVLIVPKGAWSNLTPYEMLDLVSEGDKAYLARQASVGMRPSEDPNMTYWQPFGSSASIATTDTPGLVMPSQSQLMQLASLLQVSMSLTSRTSSSQTLQLEIFSSMTEPRISGSMWHLAQQQQEMPHHRSHPGVQL